jgi:hypothetical protein
MKSSALFVLAATTKLAAAVPAQQILGQPNMQFEMPEVLKNKDFLPLSWPGIDLDLGERRLVQMEDSQEPIWITELEKASQPIHT